MTGESQRIRDDTETDEHSRMAAF